jgi:hypothetical protein
MVADRREFIRLDVGYFDNPKVAEVLDESPLAVVLHVASMAHARQHRTDGIVSKKQLLRKVGAIESDAKLLIDMGLWHDLGEGKVEVHDYAKHQETRADIEARSNAARKANEVRWNSSRIPIGSEPESGLPPIGNPEERRGEKRREEAPLVSPTREEPRDAHYENDRSPLETVSPETVLPRSFVASTRHKAYAMEKGLDIGEELAAFKDHARANGRTLVDWSAGFSSWLRAGAKRSKGERRPGSSVWDNDITGQGERS